jgi:hypothetical protein
MIIIIRGTVNTAMRLIAFQGFLCGTEPASASGYHKVQVQNYSSAILFYGLLAVNALIRTE